MSEEIRSKISALLADMTKTTLALRARGIDPSQREDREALETIKRITAQTYLNAPMPDGNDSGGTVEGATTGLDHSAGLVRKVQGPIDEAAQLRK